MQDATFVMLILILKSVLNVEAIVCSFIVLALSNCPSLHLFFIYCLLKEFGAVLLLLITSPTC